MTKVTRKVRTVMFCAALLPFGGTLASQSQCLEPADDTIGVVSDRYCGHEGIALFYAGAADGIQTFFDANGEDPQLRWDSRECHQCGPELKTSTADGRSNTYEHLWGFNGSQGVSHFVAAQYCVEKGEGWFLPAIGQLDLVWQHRERIDFEQIGLEESMMPYWSSSNDPDSRQAFHQRFNDGEQGVFFKHFLRNVRCARSS
ncbi:hypothetical protein [Azoarcus taiwanensis]|uniref:DUF1566 domain-containing protein n=1 Tax=Azoarcus taiwanensis TaxID=666964 RepID=A0A972JBI9_9RHOO|nr:hypothetical protein [Azoarcus taiwanensis]NMG05080.1 hypothetical protein [Azoarcus taiwanensis]